MTLSNQVPVKVEPTIGLERVKVEAKLDASKEFHDTLNKYRRELEEQRRENAKNKMEYSETISKYKLEVTLDLF
jgi:hypothetical protein